MNIYEAKREIIEQPVEKYHISNDGDRADHDYDDMRAVQIEARLHPTFEKICKAYGFWLD